MNPQVTMKTTLGEIVVELYLEKAPITVENFLKYVKDKHYNGTIFHRVVVAFVIQGGGFTANFKQKKTRPPIKNEANNGLKNLRGTIAMARTDDVDSATCQFFINTEDNIFLDHRNKEHYGYCVFGKVISGMETVDKIDRLKTEHRGALRDVPEKTVEILEVTQRTPQQ